MVEHPQVALVVILGSTTEADPMVGMTAEVLVDQMVADLEETKATALLRNRTKTAADTEEMIVVHTNPRAGMNQKVTTEDMAEEIIRRKEEMEEEVPRKVARRHPGPKRAPVSRGTRSVCSNYYFFFC